ARSPRHAPSCRPTPWRVAPRWRWWISSTVRDQLPRGFVETYRLANQLAKAAADGKDAHVDPRQLPETTRFISDTRYLIGAVVAPRGQALFRWQEDDGSREPAATQWIAQGGSALQPLFTGCAPEPLLPDAYHAACRNADEGLRLYSLRAAVAFLQTVLNVKPQQLRVVVAPFHEERLEEYRVGFTLSDASDVVHGVVWPLLGAEDESTDCVGQIETVLEEAGIGSVISPRSNASRWSSATTAACRCTRRRKARPPTPSCPRTARRCRRTCTDLSSFPRPEGPKRAALRRILFGSA
ncbi:MAG: DUF2863 family protein, partial [Rhodocyclaceae bacterium]|nr:DUF2863 family protein [Rhodocyclaceae bacterium]